MKTLEELEKEYPPDVSVFKVAAVDDDIVKLVQPRAPGGRRKAHIITLRVRYAYWIIDPNTCEPFSSDEFVNKQIHNCIDELDALKNAMALFCGKENLYKLKHDLYRLRDAKQKTLTTTRNNVTPPAYSTLFKQKRKVRK